MHHVTGVHVVGTDGDGNVGLSWNMLEKLPGTRVHAAHEGNGVFSVHIVHYVEVAHFVVGGGAADERRERLAADWTGDDPRRARNAHSCLQAWQYSPYVSVGGHVLTSKHASGCNGVAVLQIHVLVGWIESLAKKRKENKETTLV